MSMAVPAIATEVIVAHTRQSLGFLYLDGMAQPGSSLELRGDYYTVLERRHRYQLRLGKYHLQASVVYVQPMPPGAEKSAIDGRWIIGDGTCRFNARSELVRCAVRPTGPCAECPWYEPI